jgi:hypothetical protein
MKSSTSPRSAASVKSTRERALLGLCLLWSGFASTLVSCKAQTVSSKTEDEARAMIPVPICVKRLPRGSTPGAIVSLAAEEYWPVLLPSFDENGSTIDPSAPDCSGRLSLSPLSPGANALRVDPAKVTLAPGADGMKMVWLQSHPLGEETFEGLLALVRQRESYMEVYALGTHRGRPEGTPRMVVEAIQEDCRGEGAERRCRASISVYLMRTGMLKAAATFPIEQATRGTRDGNPVEYRFSASADYRDTSITLSEHLSVNTKGQGETRSSDLERAFRLEGGQLIASGESLWAKTLRELGQKPE